MDQVMLSDPTNATTLSDVLDTPGSYTPPADPFFTDLTPAPVWGGSSSGNTSGSSVASPSTSPSTWQNVLGFLGLSANIATAAVNASRPTSLSTARPPTAVSGSLTSSSTFMYVVIGAVIFIGAMLLFGRERK